MFSILSKSVILLLLYSPCTVYFTVKPPGSWVRNSYDSELPGWLLFNYCVYVICCRRYSCL